MGRIRTIKPEFWKNEYLSALPESTHMLAAALINYADDEGYFNANPLLIKGECSPLREASVSIPESLRSLQEINYLDFGSLMGRAYGRIVNFGDHQRVSHPSPSKIKELDIIWEGSMSPPEIIVSPPESLRPEQGMEGNGKEQGKESNANALLAPNGPLPCPHDEIVNLYHETFPELRKVRVWNNARQGFLRTRWREEPERQTTDWWKRFFVYIRKSDFLMGRTEKPFDLDLEWIVRPKNFIKILEGKYNRDRAAQH